MREQEEGVLQALEILTRDQTDLVWLKAADVRSQVAQLLGQAEEQFGHAQWIAHIMTRLHLLDNSNRKRLMDGMVYGIRRAQVLDMMQRYNVNVVVPSHV